MSEKEKLDVKDIAGQQHFTKPPARYSDAGLVKKMEEHGIGRPSTYAPTINTIVTRNYVERDENKRLKPTDIAFVVNDLLVNHFHHIVDFKFTADMENDLDSIAAGEKEWQPVIGDFYTPFHNNLAEKYEQLSRKDIMPEEKSQEICDKCGAPMIIKTGRYGKFYACSAYPNCKNIKSVDKNKDGVVDEKDKAISEQVEKLKEKYKDQKCDKCGADMIIRTGRFGPFLACSAYPKCKNIKSIEENNQGTGVKCPVCGKGEIVQKRSRRGAFYACNNYPDCKTSFSNKPTGQKCPKCQSLMLEGRDGDDAYCSNKDCGK
jgi:DNA topoisomerase-1